MSSTPQLFDAADHDEHTAALSTVDAAREDAYWRRAFRCERYYSRGLSYEDYAPAYCAGYSGYAQYGGEYDDAEASLWANWQRIKGDSRLIPDDARHAMRAAWDRMAHRPEFSAMRHRQPAPCPAGSTMGAAPG
jgi:hypothetical protein